MNNKPNKLRQVSDQQSTSMRNQAKPTPGATGEPGYPDKTTGSEASAVVRKAANRWGDSKRSSLFERGMQIIYGGTASKEKVRPRQ
jgi:hypothetical protein